MTPAMIEHVRRQPGTHLVATLLETDETGAPALEAYARVGTGEWQLLQPAATALRARLLDTDAVVLLLLAARVPTYIGPRLLTFVVNPCSVAGKAEAHALARQTHLRWHFISEVGYHGEVRAANPARAAALDLLARAAQRPAWTPVEVEVARATFRDRYPDAESLWHDLAAAGVEGAP